MTKLSLPSIMQDEGKHFALNQCNNCQIVSCSSLMELLLLFTLLLSVPSQSIILPVYPPSHHWHRSALCSLVVQTDPSTCTDTSIRLINHMQFLYCLSFTILVLILAFSSARFLNLEKSLPSIPEMCLTSFLEYSS